MGSVGTSVALLEMKLRTSFEITTGCLDNYFLRKKEEKMSIFPRIVKRGKDKFVNLHMHVENHGKKAISGSIRFTVISPSGKRKKIEEKVTIKKRSKVDKYYRYPLKKNAIAGRYLVDGIFFFKGGQIRSETYKTDFFDIIDE